MRSSIYQIEGKTTPKEGFYYLAKFTKTVRKLRKLVHEEARMSPVSQKYASANAANVFGHFVPKLVKILEVYNLQLLKLSNLPFPQKFKEASLMKSPDSL